MFKNWNNSKRLRVGLMALLVLGLASAMMLSRASAGKPPPPPKPPESYSPFPGVVLTSTNGVRDAAFASFLDSNQNLVAAGSAVVGPTSDFALLRYRPDGALDPTFGGGDGVVTTNLNSGDVAYAAATYPGGRIVLGGNAAGYYGGDFGLARYNQDGSLDRTFGRNGKVQTDFGGMERLYALMVQSEGKVVVGGSSNASGSFQWTLARYTASGQLDNSFGSGGIVQTPLFAEVNALGLHQGKILAVGHEYSFNNVVLVRYNENGSLDTDFGTSGIAMPGNIFGGGEGLGFAVQADGGIVVAGTATGGGGGFAVARYNADGSVDTDFGDNGLAVVALPGVHTLTAVAIQSDGKIVGAGYGVTEPGYPDFAVVRWNPDGSLDDGSEYDTTRGDQFGASGFVITPILYRSFARSVAIQPDDRITLAGYADVEPQGQRMIALARYNPDGTLDDSFDAGPP